MSVFGYLWLLLNSEVTKARSSSVVFLVSFLPLFICNTDVICNQLFGLGFPLPQLLLVAEQVTQESDVLNHFAAPSTQMFLSCLSPKKEKKKKRRRIDKAVMK